MASSFSRGRIYFELSLEGFFCCCHSLDERVLFAWQVLFPFELIALRCKTAFSWGTALLLSKSFSWMVLSLHSCLASLVWTCIPPILWPSPVGISATTSQLSSSRVLFGSFTFFVLLHQLFFLQLVSIVDLSILSAPCCHQGCWSPGDCDRCNEVSGTLEGSWIFAGCGSLGGLEFCTWVEARHRRIGLGHKFHVWLCRLVELQCRQPRLER